MAKGLRSTVKLRARNVKRTDPNGDFVKVQKQREAEIAARLAERKFQPTTSQLARLQDIQERKDADQEITQEEEEFLQSGGKVDVPQQPQDAPMAVDDGTAAPASTGLGSLSKTANQNQKKGFRQNRQKGKKLGAKRTHKQVPAGKRLNPKDRKPANYI